MNADLNECLGRPRTPVRVLLISPSQQSVYGMPVAPAYPPLGLLWVAAVLEKAGHAVEVVDLDADRLSTADLETLLRANRYAVVGLTAVTATYHEAVRTARLVRRTDPAARLVLGGIHATVAAAECLEGNAFDYIVVGEGECTFLELVDALAAGGSGTAAIPGLVYRDAQGAAVTTAPRDLIPNLDLIPFPARHLVRHPARYSPADATYLPAHSIMVSRGCPGRCTYCQTKQIFGRTLRFRSADNVMAEIRQLRARHGLRELHFLDDVMTGNRRFVLDLCEQLRREPYRLKLEVANGVRADMVDEEVLTALKGAGLQNIGFGVESGNEGVLEDIQKGITKDQVRKAMRLAKKLKLKTWCFFMIGLPRDTEATIRETIRFAMELDPLYAKFLLLKPFPGSEVHRQLAARHLIVTADYSRYGVYTPPVHRLETLTEAQLLSLQQEAFRRFYLRPRKMLEHLLSIRSAARLKSLFKGAFFVLNRMRPFRQDRPAGE